MSTEQWALTISVISILISLGAAFTATSTLKSNMLSLMTRLLLRLDDRIFKNKRRLELVKAEFPEYTGKQQENIETLESAKESLKASYKMAKELWLPAFLIERLRHGVEASIQSAESAEWHEEEIDKLWMEMIENKREIEELKKVNRHNETLIFAQKDCYWSIPDPIVDFSVN